MVEVTAGDTFLIEPPGTNGGHLWIVLVVYCNELDGTNYAEIVNVTSIRHGHDTACILRQGDHPFVHHDSFVFYGGARTVEIAKLDKLSVARQERVSDKVLIRVVRGLHCSKFTKRGIKKLVPQR
jgi:hypothetical protein